MHVVVAAESHLDRQILENTTRKAGYSDVNPLTNGQEVLNVLQETNVDVVITEKHLGDITAIQLADHVIARSGEATPSIIIFADEFTSEEAVDAIRAGAESLLIKPVLPEQLREKIESLD